MTATGTRTLDMLPNMRDVAVVIAKDASENLAGVDVISVGPLYAELAPGGRQYSVVVIVLERDGKELRWGARGISAVRGRRGIPQ